MHTTAEKKKKKKEDQTNQHYNPSDGDFSQIQDMVFFFPTQELGNSLIKV